jgi:hypothetical protein
LIWEEQKARLQIVRRGEKEHANPLKSQVKIFDFMG